jgi:hypothetical protein
MIDSFQAHAVLFIELLPVLAVFAPQEAPAIGLPVFQA